MGKEPFSFIFHTCIMLSATYFRVPDVLLLQNVCFPVMQSPKKGQINLPLPHQSIPNTQQTAPKPKKQQRKRYRVAPRKAAMISTCPHSPLSSPVPNSPPPSPASDFSLNLPPKTTSVNAFLDSFQSHIPSSFDIIRRGSIPGLQVSTTI